MTERASAWSITINNPGNADEENINLARQKGWKVIGQLEKGKNGTPHYQLLVKTPQVRFSAVKKQFPRAHIEVARNIGALEQYVNKEETREGGLKESDDMYPSLQKLWDLLAEYIQENGLHCQFIDASPDYKLVMFDKFINHIIYKGFVVETMAVNPQIRSCIKQFGENIYFRSLRRQSDRQTPSLNISEVDITNAADETQTTPVTQTESVQETISETGEVGSTTSSEGSCF